MWESFLTDNNQWINFGLEHLLSFLGFALIGVFFLRFGKSLPEKKQWSYWMYFCIGIWIVQYLKIVIKFYLGDFDYQHDLPFELCNMLPIFMTFMIYKKSRKWWGILFFWIIAGTFQSTITTTLQHSIPHFEYWRYWIIHMFLTFAAIYGIVIFKFWPTLKDAWNSFVWMNIVAWSMFGINYLIGSNYMFMQGKPPGKTIYDMLGDWPIYLLQLQGLLWVLFIIILLPFWIYDYFIKNKA